MASIVEPSLAPCYRPLISFLKEKAFLAKYLRGGSSIVLEERYEPGEAPGRAFLASSRKCVADFVPVHARMGMCPEARALIEEFEPGAHQFLPVEIVRPRSKKPIHRLDGRVLDTPYYVLIPQTVLEAVRIERSEVSVSPTRHGSPLVFPAMGSDNIVLRREVVRGHHVWCGRFHPSGRTFFSDALVRALEARKLRGLSCVRLEEA
ncbi:MAG: hypothetical protein ICV73_02605 [Acetobacteraceae bacterium]|nr:hypothetical protein [Acetobacteraceae bacterium]